MTTAASGMTAAASRPATALPRRVRPLLDGDPSTIGPYAVLGRIAQGPGGLVFLSRAVGGAQVALRVPEPPPTISERDSEPPPTATGQGPDAARRLRAHLCERFAAAANSARAAAGPHRCAVLDSGVVAPDPDIHLPASASADGGAEPAALSRFAGLPYLVTEFVDGPTLAREVAERGPLSPAELHVLASALLDGLRAARRAGGPAGDLCVPTPDDIVLSLTGPRLVNLGLGTTARPGGDDGPPDPAVAAWARVVALAGTGCLPPPGWPNSGGMDDPATVAVLNAMPRGPVRTVLRDALTSPRPVSTPARTAGGSSGSGTGAEIATERDAAGLARLDRLRASLDDRPGMPVRGRRRAGSRSRSPVRQAREVIGAGAAGEIRRAAGSGSGSEGVRSGDAARGRWRWRPVAAGVMTAVTVVAVAASTGPSSGPTAVVAGATVPLAGAPRSTPVPTPVPDQPGDPRRPGGARVVPAPPPAEPAPPPEEPGAAEQPAVTEPGTPLSQPPSGPTASGGTGGSPARARPPGPAGRPAPVRLAVAAPTPESATTPHASTPPAAPMPPAAAAGAGAGPAPNGPGPAPASTPPTPTSGLTPVQIGVVPLSPR